MGTVVGFPLGYVHPEIRRAESRQAVADGAGELDTVLNLSWLKSGEDQRVLADLAGWVEAMRREREGLILKVILETALLTDEEKVRGARLVVQSGADFVKTSTGFSKGARPSRTSPCWRRPSRGGSASRPPEGSATPRRRGR